jgi:hypothetical protein
LIMIFGPGSISLDYLIGRYIDKRQGAALQPAPITISQKL